MEQFRVDEILKTCHNLAKTDYEKIEEIAMFNQKKVLDAFRKNRITYMHFNPSNGYGYDDIAREKLNKLYSDVLGAEASIVSPLIANGTHALTLGFFGLLRPNDTLVSISGKPYDTLDEVINGEGNGSLKDFNINYKQIELLDNGDFDVAKIDVMLTEIKPKLVFMQRSKGYAWRDAVSVYDIGKMIAHIKEISPKTLVMVDNCYGEFVEDKEPTEFGADLIVGSLIKNIGGGLAPTGGYLSGKQACIDQVAYRLTAPSLGLEVGSYAASYQPFYQGLFLAPSTVKNAMKGNILAGYVFKLLNYDTMPKVGTIPKDTIRSIKFDTAEELIAFCQKIQTVSPIDSYVTPEPWDMPGYGHQVIMAAGTFVQGASLELTADGTVRDPYVAYLQGGLTYEHCKIALMEYLLDLNINI